jgi:hypothetical protein
MGKLTYYVAELNRLAAVTQDILAAGLKLEGDCQQRPSLPKTIWSTLWLEALIYPAAL